MDPLEYLFSLELLGIKFGLDNIRALTTALGDPQDAFPSLIVAGTNGKGSVAAMTERALRAAGFHTGLYTSPHVVRLEERFRIDGVPVSTEALRAVAGTVQLTIAALRASGQLSTDPTFFEATTAAAFELFRRERVDIGVLEVGMGGRFDATNVTHPVVAAITTVDLDHQAFLGHTIREIAAEKAGVIKPGMTVVLGETKADAVEVIGAACRDRGATLVMAGGGVSVRATLRDGLVEFALRTPGADYGTMTLGLPGVHQALNALVAVRLLEALRDRGFAVPVDAVRAGLSDVTWPGRLQRVRVAGGELLLDAAHNPAGARVLADYLRATYPRGVPLVFGAMRDKDVAGMLTALLPAVNHLVVTAPATRRAATVDAIATLAARLAAIPVDRAPTPRDAVRRALEFGPTAVVAGSIYLIGEVLTDWPPG